MQDSPVTQKQWQMIMGNNPSKFKGKSLPVESINWPEAKEFIQKLALDDKTHIYRLPTEKEFEFAMGKDPSDSKLKDYAWYYNNSGYKTHPVKKKKPNEYGLYDMRGNVWEWCEDEVHGSFRVIRGGSWGYDARYLRSAFRVSYGPGFRFDFLGFRLLRTRIDPLTLSPSKSEAREAKAELIKNIRKSIEQHASNIQTLGDLLKELESSNE